MIYNKIKQHYSRLKKDTKLQDLVPILKNFVYQKLSRDRTVIFRSQRSPTGTTKSSTSTIMATNYLTCNLLSNKNSTSATEIQLRCPYGGARNHLMSFSSSIYYKIQNSTLILGKSTVKNHNFIVIQDLALINEAFCVRQMERIIKNMNKSYHRYMSMV